MRVNKQTGYPMKSTAGMILLLIFFVYCGTAGAQSTRSLNGTLSLDVIPPIQSLVLDVTVRNHSLVVIPPSFQILRPITSQQTTRINVSSTGRAVAYRIDGIINDPDDYSVQIKCVSCTSLLPTQFYTTDGNRLSLVAAAYIDPADLPELLDLTAITRAFIRGSLVLDQTAQRDLLFDISVLSANNPQSVLRILPGVLLPQGQMTQAYVVSGIYRSIGADRYSVAAKCTNCFGKSARRQFFPLTLSPDQNHAGIDFQVSDQGLVPLAPAIYILMQDNATRAD